jgi:hypothetical protein
LVNSLPEPSPGGIVLQTVGSSSTQSIVLRLPNLEPGLFFNMILSLKRDKMMKTKTRKIETKRRKNQMRNKRTKNFMSHGSGTRIILTAGKFKTMHKLLKLLQTRPPWREYLESSRICIATGNREVAFALKHLNRRASISAEYLKPPYIDALIASGEFDVSLPSHPCGSIQITTRIMTIMFVAETLPRSRSKAVVLRAKRLGPNGLRGSLYLARLLMTESS